MKYRILIISIMLIGIFVVFISKSKSNIIDTPCGNNQIFAIDTSNKYHKCLNTTLIYRLSAVNLNSANTDVGGFINLPSKYIIRRFTGDNPSTSLTLATVDLRTSTSGGGTAIVSTGVLSALTGSTKYIDITLAVLSDTQTTSTLTIRNITPQAVAATADFTLEVTPIP